MAALYIQKACSAGSGQDAKGLVARRMSGECWGNVGGMVGEIVCVRVCVCVCVCVCFYRDQYGAKVKVGSRGRRTGAASVGDLIDGSDGTKLDAWLLPGG